MIGARWPGRKMHRFARFLAAAVLAGLVLWTAGLAWFATLVPRAVADPDSRTDAIVVLTGGPERVRQGLELLRAGMAGKLFISGVYEGVDVAKILSVSGEGSEDLACCIELGHDAIDTVGNARETAAWAGVGNYRSLRLVTSDYHMPRSLAVFRRAMPHIELIAHPVFSDTVRMESWWLSPGTAGLLASEFNKFLVVRLSGLGESARAGGSE